MKELLKKCKNKIIFYVAIYLGIFFIARFILVSFNLEFREWIYTVTTIISILGIFAGVIQLIHGINNRVNKIVSIIVFVSLIAFLSMPTFGILALLYEPEEVVEVENVKFIERTFSFLGNTMYDYHKYINFIVRGKDRIPSPFEDEELENIENDSNISNSLITNTNTITNTITNDASGTNTVSNSLSSQNEVNNNASAVRIDITDKLKEKWYDGIIKEITAKKIVFCDEDKIYELKIDSSTKYLNARTEESMNFSDIKVGDHIDTFYYYGGKDFFAISRNISGEELKNELLKNFARDPNTQIAVVNTPEWVDLKIENKNRAIFTMKFSDVYASYFYENPYSYENIDKLESFEIKVLINQNTKIDSKSGLSYSIDTLELGKNDMLTVYLDKNTLNYEYPVVTIFSSSDN